MKLKSFTLAEMLVVMTIVAVLAMLTIPTVVTTNRDKAYSDMLEKTYQKIENTLIITKILGLDVGGLEYASIDKSMNAEQFYKLLNSTLKTIKDCNLNEDGCFETNELKGYKLRLISGAGILVNDDFRGEVDSVDRNNRITGATYIDIDGINGPNKPGIDQFGFYTTQKGLIPMGGPQDKIIPFEKCLNEGGFACTAWILVNKNMDYKKCPKVINWETKTSCE